MPSQAPPRLVSTSTGEPLSILPPSVALSESLCDLREKPPADRVFAAGSVMDLVARHCLGVPSMAFVGLLQEGGTVKGGPTRWPEIVLSIIATWPDDGPGPWNRWRAFVASCVAAYAEPWQAMREATLRLLDPASAREDAEQDGIEDAAAFLSGTPEPPTPAASPEAPEPEPIEAPAEPSPKAKLDAEAVDVRATAAAFALRQEGKPISLRAVCKRAGIDRDNLTKNYPATVSFIDSMSRPDRAPKKGVRDRKTGNVDAIAND